MKGDFLVAVHALVYLRHHQGRPVSSEELAENICTTSPKVRKSLSLLAKEGFVESRMGMEGGYSLKRDDVTLREVAKVLDTKFVCTNFLTGNVDKKCLISSHMGAYMRNLLAQLNETCIQSLSKVTIKDIEDEIFRDSPTFSQTGSGTGRILSPSSEPLE